jgi:hypothetical protein
MSPLTAGYVCGCIGSMRLPGDMRRTHGRSLERSSSARRHGKTEGTVMDLPRIFTIRESSHRIHNPLTEVRRF